MSRTRAAAVLVALSCSVVVIASEKLTPDELVKRHVAAQLSGAAPSADHERDIRGQCTVTTPVSVAGVLTGTFQLASSTQASKLTMQFPSDVYPGENFSVSGSEVNIGFAQPRTSSRSALGLFLSTNRVIVGEGLLGGVLNARWPLIDASLRNAKLSYDGMKKLAGRDLHRLRYRAKRDQGQLDVYLYFEPDTFRHVGSVYSASRAQSMGFTPETSSQRSETYFRLEETFADFQQVGGLTLPKTWTLRYDRSGDTSSMWKYELKVQSVDEPETKRAAR